MKLEINDSKTIQTIQHEFNDQFPYLKIEFFSKAHEAGEGSKKKLMEKGDKTLQECRTVHDEGVLQIVPSMTVAGLESNFQILYGLSMQVFRKSGKVWLETVQTDHWTLAEQNRHGESMVKEKHELEDE